MGRASAKPIIVRLFGDGFGFGSTPAASSSIHTVLLARRSEYTGAQDGLSVTGTHHCQLFGDGFAFASG
jgi:hypothetical protein